ncbi:OLC1v1020983C3 [Oldenlandia corymbosa var. corymbosa]|uniref:OLC1v1020983C3 n=1 Tax=Oldenlandia corymbosa var. corymbosa TaxID=529605 RepID=A0AAV1BX36_OLDCO|nr:OLC1v1020983C3 [Oldenlandia corymbosa var. corymbosa]
MDLHGNTPQVEHGRFEQILNQFLLKSLHIILDSRVPSIRMPLSRQQRGGELKKSDKWFNLALGDRPAVLDNLNFWHRNLMEPMIIDIILVQDKPCSSSSESGSRTPTSTSGLGNTLAETVIERWIVQYEHLRTVPMAMSPQSTGDVSYKKLYKKSIILLRCLYSMMRLLPAYKAFRKLSSSSQTCEFDINYKVSAYCVPFSRAEEDLMKTYTFTPVDAQQGRFSISVTYRENLSDYNLECSTSFPPEIIADYVGSPLADPLRAFPSSLEKGYHHGASLLSRGSPLRSSTTPSQRPHSWTSGLHRGVSSPQGQQHMPASPPLYRVTSYEGSPSDIHGPKQLQDYRSPVHQKALYFEHDYQLSPPFSPSPPTYFPSSTPPVQTRMRSETAPVSIPHQPILGRGSRYLSPNLSDPNRNSLPPLSPRFVKHESSSQESPSGARSLRRPESLRSGESSYGITNLGQKVSRDAKEDSGRFSGLLSSSDSPRVGFSRSSSRLSFQDDLDECDFSCPFIVDDVDTSDSHARGGASETSMRAYSTARRSQDAAVGALVHMLRTAPPLRLDSSGYASRSDYPSDMGSGASSGFFLPRKTSDALEELKVYKEMKELLLSKSATREVAAKEGAAPSG